MATLAVLPTDPLDFSDVIAFFGRDNPTAPQPFGGIGNYPPRGGVGFSGVDAITHSFTQTWPTFDPPIQGDNEGLAWINRTTVQGPGQISVTGRSVTFDSVRIILGITKPASAGAANIDVVLYNGATEIRRATVEFLAVDVNENHTFQVGAIGTFDTIQDGSSIGFAVESTSTNFMYSIVDVQMPVSLAGGSIGQQFFPQPERLSWYNRGGGIVPSTATFTDFEFRRTYRPNTLSVADGNFAIKDRIQDTSSTQQLSPFGDTWPNNVFVSVAAIYLVSIDADYNAVETFFGITFNGNVQSLLGYFIRFTHPGGTATYPVTSVRVGAAELWVQFQHEVQSEAGVPPADGTGTIITLIDSGSGITQQINEQVDTAGGAVSLSSLRNVDNGVL